MYGSVLAEITDEGLIFRYVPDSDTISSYFKFGQEYNPRVFKWLNDTDVFVTSYSSTNDHVIMARVNMTQMTYTWYRNISCTQLGS